MAGEHEHVEPAAPQAPEVAAAPPETVAAAASPADPAPVEAPPATAEGTPAPAADAPKHPSEQPSLLDSFGKTEDKPAEPAKPVEEKKPAEAAAEPKTEETKPADAKPAEGDAAAAAAAAAEAAKPAAIEPPSYAELKLPEGLVKDEKLDAFTSEIGKYGVPVDAAEKMLGLHADALKAYSEHVSLEQYRVFDETRAGWRKEVMADPQLGGAGYQTAMGAIARMRDMFVAEKDAPAFNEFLRITGAGDHPQFLKFLHNAARLFDEPPLPPPNPKPPANQGGKRGRGALYDHPSSNQAGRQ